jgi:hypothetical protein
MEPGIKYQIVRFPFPSELEFLMSFMRQKK